MKNIKKFFSSFSFIDKLVTVFTFIGIYAVHFTIYWLVSKPKTFTWYEILLTTILSMILTDKTMSAKNKAKK